uniref:EGF-like domain-containing protein n=1 Tax=Myripristis murdjan TaxID=586833 RepID=A0A667ZSN6_9TELE
SCESEKCLWICNFCVCAFIIFSIRHEIRRIDLHKRDYSLLVPGLRNTIALDFHFNRSLLYWTDVVEDKIYRGRLSESGVTGIEVVVQHGLATPEGLAVDWIAGKLYWIDSNLDQIEVAMLNGDMRTTLIAGGMEHPRAIALDPGQGILFWTDWDATFPRIEAASMSGGGRHIVFKDMEIGAWPNGLTLDHLEKRIVWTDARYKISQNKTILKGHEYLSHPFAVSLFGGNVYWTDWRTNTLARANKWTGQNVTVIQKTSAQPFDLQIFHPTSNPCEENDGRGPCSHLCLINYNRTASCTCPHLMKLSPNKQSCFGEGSLKRFLLYVRRSEIRGVDIDNPYMNVMTALTVPDIDDVTVVDYDALEERIYWADVKTQAIKRAFINGTQLETVISGDIVNCRGLALDWLSRNLYWLSSENDESQINVARLDGSLKTSIIHGIDKPRCLVVHPAKGANLSLLCALAFLSGLSIDYTANKLYWISSANGTINRCNLDGSGLEVLETLKKQLAKGSALAVMGEWSLSGEHQMAINNGGCTQLCFPTSENTRSCSCTVGYNLRSDRMSCEGERAICLFQSGIRKHFESSLTLNWKCSFIIPFSLVMNRMVCSAGNDTVYWTDMGLNRISRAKRDQTWREDIITTGISRVEGIAVDWIAGNLYWTDHGFNLIEISRLNGAYRSVVISEGLDQPRAIAVHPQKGYLFWTEWGQNPCIGRSRLDGSDQVTLVNSGIAWPNGISIDYEVYPSLRGLVRDVNFQITFQENRLYWCDARTDKIERINLETGESREIVLSAANVDLFSVAVGREKGTNPCARSNGGCQQLCFHLGSGRRTCSCAHGHLAEDGFNRCVSTLSLAWCSFKRGYTSSWLDLSAVLEQHVCLIQDILLEHEQWFYVSVLLDVGSVEGLAYHRAWDTLYWTSSTTNTITRQTVDQKRAGALSRQSVVTLSEEDHPHVLALDECQNLMFWTNWNEQRPSIMRSTLAGNNVRVIISSDILTPNGLTIDHKAEKLYFSDGSLGRIERCEYDGSNRYVISDSEFFLSCCWSIFTGELSPCRHMNGGCGDLCLLTPYGRVNCTCRGERVLLDDNRCFECGNGECINYQLTCDGVAHCKDKSDERCSTDDQFRCHNNLCISLKWLCDGQEDCKTGEDEKNCQGTGADPRPSSVNRCHISIFDAPFMTCDTLLRCTDSVGTRCMKQKRPCSCSQSSVYFTQKNAFIGNNIMIGGPSSGYIKVERRVILLYRLVHPHEPIRSNFELSYWVLYDMQDWTDSKSSRLSNAH